MTEYKLSLSEKIGFDPEINQIENELLETPTQNITWSSADEENFKGLACVFDNLADIHYMGVDRNEDNTLWHVYSSGLWRYTRQFHGEGRLIRWTRVRSCEISTSDTLPVEQKRIRLSLTKEDDMSTKDDFRFLDSGGQLLKHEFISESTTSYTFDVLIRYENYSPFQIRLVYKNPDLPASKSEDLSLYPLIDSMLKENPVRDTVFKSEKIKISTSLAKDSEYLFAHMVSDSDNDLYYVIFSDASKKLVFMHHDSEGWHEYSLSFPWFSTYYFKYPSLCVLPNNRIDLFGLWFGKNAAGEEDLLRILGYQFDKKKKNFSIENKIYREWPVRLGGSGGCDAIIEAGGSYIDFVFSAPILEGYKGEIGIYWYCIDAPTLSLLNSALLKTLERSSAGKADRSEIVHVGGDEKFIYYLDMPSA